MGLVIAIYLNMWYYVCSEGKLHIIKKDMSELAIRRNPLIGDSSEINKVGSDVFIYFIVTIIAIKSNSGIMIK